MEYIALGHAKKVDFGICDIFNGPFFLAHHGIINKSSKTTKLGVVFDGGMLSKAKISINDVLLNGSVV